MRITAPYDLEQTVTDAAEQKGDKKKACGREAPFCTEENIAFQLGSSF